MSWNYRILRKTQPNTVWCNIPGKPVYLYTIAEVYRDENGEIDGWCERNDILEWDDLGDLTGTIKLLQYVIGTPVLEEKNNTLVEIKNKEKNNGTIDKSNN